MGSLNKSPHQAYSIVGKARWAHRTSHEIKLTASLGRRDGLIEQVTTSSIQHRWEGEMGSSNKSRNQAYSIVGKARWAHRASHHIKHRTALGRRDGLIEQVTKSSLQHCWEGEMGSSNKSRNQAYIIVGKARWAHRTSHHIKHTASLGRRDGLIEKVTKSSLQHRWEGEMGSSNKSPHQAYSIVGKARWAHRTSHHIKLTASLGRRDGLIKQVNKSRSSL